MGKRGPNKLPNELKLQRGTFRSNQDGDPNSLPVAKLKASEIPAAPVTLNEYGRTLWYSVLQEYTTLEVVSKNLDLPMFEKYCWMMQETQRLEQELMTEGYLTSGAYSEVQNPKFNVYMKLFDSCMKISKEYGLTPASRQNIRLNQERINKDPLSEFEEL